VCTKLDIYVFITYICLRKMRTCYISITKLYKPGGAVLASSVDAMVVLSCVVAGVFVVGWATCRECCHTANIKDKHIESFVQSISSYTIIMLRLAN